MNDDSWYYEGSGWRIRPSQNETSEQQRARMQAECRNYVIANNPPKVVAQMKRAWRALDRRAGS